MLIPEEKQSAALTLWMVAFESGQIICPPHEVTGPVRLFASGRYEVPPEWLERCIPLTDDQEDNRAEIMLLSALIAAGESLTLELKKSTAQKDHAVAVCARSPMGKAGSPRVSQGQRPYKVFRKMIETFRKCKHHA